VLTLAADGALTGAVACASAGHDSSPPPDPSALALILPTSGTTDRPRRVPVSHKTLLDTCAARAAQRRFTRRDRGLSVTPAYFVLGLARVVESLLPGGSTIVTSAPEVVRQPETIRDLAPTWTWMSPALLESVLTAAKKHRAVREWPFRVVRSGGAQVTPDLIARAEALWGVPALNGYGTTETLGYVTAEEDPDTIPRKAGSVGLPLPGVEIDIRADAGNPLPAGTTGEITVRGRHVFPGYLDDPAATAAAFFPEGWYRTGDLGHLDEDGYLFVTGRVREMINRGGEKIAPGEIDEVLRQHPAVKDAAAFALPDARLGEDIAVAVVAAEGATPTRRALRRWMLDRLAPHKTPRRIWFVDELPRTGSGKVQRLALSERFRVP
jgi:acyl-CoA synthetase (AMP-forming)/AMP-acid ligase II